MTSSVSSPLLSGSRPHRDADLAFNLGTDSDLPGIILDMLTDGKGSVNKEEIKVVTHRM